MFKMLIGVIFKIRDIFQKKFGEIFERFRNPETGKVTFARPKTLKKIIMIVSFVVFFLIFFSKLIGNNIQLSGGLDSYEKELTPSVGIGLKDVRTGGSEEDPFKGLGNITRDQYGAGTGRSTNEFTGINDPMAAGDGPSLSQCVDLINKMKANQTLSTEEQATAQACLEKNEMGLTTDELNFAKTMLDPNTTAAEKALLAKALAGTATNEELAVARSLATGTAEEKALAKAAVARGEDAINALGKQLDGRTLTPEEQALLELLRSDVANAKQQEEVKASEAVSESGQKIPVDLQATTEALQAASQEIANREAEIRDLEQKLADAQLRVSPISEKLAAGRQITEGENKTMQDFAKSRQDLDALKKAQEARKTAFARRVSKAQTGLARAVTTVQGSLPTGSFIEYEGEAFDCSKVKPLPVKKKPRKAVIAKKEKVLDLDGRELRPEEVEFIKLQRKKMYELSQAKKDAMNPNGLEGLGQPISLASMGQDGQPIAIQDLQSLVVFKDTGLKNFELTPDMKIAAVLESQILVSDKGKGQIVRVRILADVHNPQTNEILIPKGAIAVGMTSGFDADTGVMDINFDKVVIGSGKTLSVKFAVGSADDTMGLKGRIHDTTGKYLLGAFITSFTAGALGYFSQKVVAPYQQSTIAGTALQGAGLAGSADVMQKISELYAGKLQNSAIVFWAPKNLPVILYPQ